MTLDELQSQLKSAGLVPILVANATPNDEGSRLLFAGSLNEYVEVAKALNAQAVIVYSETLDESDFLAEPGADSLEEDGGTYDDVATVDLCTIHPELSQFKKRLGQHGLYCVSISIQDEHLDLALTEPWWRAFDDLRDDALGRLAREQHERMEAARLGVEDKAKGLLVQLHALVDDGKFICLPTQKAMLQYALRKLPELNVLSPSVLKNEIQELKAKIDADVD